MGTSQTLLAFLVTIALLAISGALVPAAAQAPACAPETAGSVACLAGRLCACGFARGSPATGLPDGFRWDCGILRPACGEPHPATSGAYRGPLPEALAIDRSETSITTHSSSNSRSSAEIEGRHPGKPAP